MATKKKSVRQKKAVKLEGVSADTLKSIAAKVDAAQSEAKTVKPKDIGSLINWLQVGEKLVTEVVKGVKDIKKSVLQSEAKAKVKTDLYFATTPLLKVKVKASDLNGVFVQHKRRLKTVDAILATLMGKAKAKKGGAK